MFRKTFQHILFLTLFAITTINAQVLDSALVVDSIKILNETGLNESDKPSVRIHNPELKNGFLDVTDVKIVNADGELLSMRCDIKHINEQNKQKSGEQTILVSETEKPTAIIGVKMDGFGDGIFLVYENTLVGIFKNDNGNYMKALKTSDDSKIFTHEGALFVAPSGAMVASTPTTLLIITPTYLHSATYKELFGVDANLVNPTITAGDEPNFAVLRDEIIKDDKGPIKLVINLNKFEIQGVPETK